MILSGSETNSGKENPFRVLIKKNVHKVHITGSRESDELLLFLFSSLASHAGFQQDCLILNGVS